MTTPSFYLKPLTTTRIPHEFSVMVAVPHLENVRGGYEQHWAGAYFSTESLDLPPSPGRASHWHGNTASLWNQVSLWAREDRAHVLWCYDLPWTLRITKALDKLPKLGWTLGAFSFTPGASWMSWHRGRRTLRILDVTSIWPESETQLSVYFDWRLPQQPQWGDSPDTWRMWALSKTSLLIRGVRRYTEWLRDNDFGSLAVTGSSQAFTAFRRQFLKEGLVIHQDSDLRALERAAAHTGRCEAWYRGTIVSDPVDEWDFSNAYTNIVASQQVPVAPLYPLTGGHDLLAALDTPNRATLATVEITTLEPVVPVRIDDRIVWPVGRFVTTLWEPEIIEALNAEAVVRLVRGHVYKTAPVLSHWATWVLHRLSLSDNSVPAWEKALLKRWGNVLVGRFGMRYPRWEFVGQTATSDVLHSIGWTDGEEDSYQLMRIGRDLLMASGQTDPTYSAPMITSWVMSAMRAKLWRLMTATGERGFLYVDTDSVLTLRAQRERMGVLAQTEIGHGLRLKRTWAKMTILGPRQIITNSGVKMAGIPRGATLVEGNVFEGEVTEGIMESIGGQRQFTVASRFRRWTVEGNDERRTGGPFGWTDARHVDLPYVPENL